MIQEFKINPIEPLSQDFVEVSQFGYIDLRVALSTGEVPSDLQGVEGSYNDIDEPSSIIGKPDDVFAAMRAKEVYVSSASSEVVTPSGGGESA